MTSRSILAFLCLMLVLAGCERAPVESRARASHDVYAAVLEHAVLEGGWAGPPSRHEDQAPIERLIVLGETDPEGTHHVSSGLAQELDGLDSATIADFNSQTESVQFTDSLKGVGAYEFVSADSLERVLRDGWRSFHRVFPGTPGLVTFSNVGFGMDGRQALVSMMHIRGGTWGHTSLYLLQKSESGWAVIDEVNTEQY